MRHQSVNSRTDVDVPNGPVLVDSSRHQEILMEVVTARVAAFRQPVVQAWLEFSEAKMRA
jgi:hypothetical protein